MRPIDGAQSRPKAPQGLQERNYENGVHGLPGARFSGLGEALFLSNPIMV